MLKKLSVLLGIIMLVTSCSITSENKKNSEKFTPTFNWAVPSDPLINITPPTPKINFSGTTNLPPIR